MSAAQRKRLRVFSDGKGHFLAFPAHPRDSEPNLVFFGDGKLFYRQDAGVYRSDTGDVQISVRDLRFAETLETTFYVYTPRPGHRPTLSCGDNYIKMTELPPAQGNQLMVRAELRDVYWRRAPRVLGRDSTGKYYYVDWLRGHRRETRPRVFLGPPGQMKLVDLKSFVTDATSETYITGDGELRLRLDPKDPPELSGADWHGGGRTASLALLNHHRNETLRMIWHELRVYGDLKQLKLQTPCDAF